MSGVYIKGLEMPEFGEKIIILTSSGYVEDVSGQVIQGIEAIPVPDHGRCIDADVILNSKGVGTQIAGWGKMYHETVIEYAPTIIPADKEVDND